MARIPMDLDVAELSEFALLLHGDYNVGKTHLAGDALRYESQFGPTKYVNVRGEDGALSIAGMGLGARGETIETYDDLLSLIADHTKVGRLQAAVIDSYKPLSRLVIRKVVGADRLPEIGGARGSEWGDVHFHMERLTTALRRMAKVLIALCPSDRSVNQLTGVTTITPDLPGREAAESTGWFDFVGYMRASVVGTGKVKRVVSFAPSSTIRTRARLQRALTEDIEIPADIGGWEKIRKAFEAHLAPGEVNKNA